MPVSLSLRLYLSRLIILELVDKEIIDFGHPLKDYIPELPYAWSSQITIRQLLYHTSGLTLLEKPLAFPHGTKLYYTNDAYDLLVKVAECIAGKKYDELVAEMFNQCQMLDSGVSGEGLVSVIQKRFPNFVSGFIAQSYGVILLELFPHLNLMI